MGICYTFYEKRKVYIYIVRNAIGKTYFQDNCVFVIEQLKHVIRELTKKVEVEVWRINESWSSSKQT